MFTGLCFGMVHKDARKVEAKTIAAARAVFLPGLKQIILDELIVMLPYQGHHENDFDAGKECGYNEAIQDVIKKIEELEC